MSIGNSHKILKNMEEPHRKTNLTLRLGNSYLPTVDWSAKGEEMLHTNQEMTVFLDQICKWEENASMKEKATMVPWLETMSPHSLKKML